MSVNFAISQILISSLLGIVTFVGGVFLYRRKDRHRRGAAKLQAYLLWGLSGIIAISNIVPLAYLYTEHLWFESVGYVDVFWKLHQTRWGIFGIFFLVALGFMNANAAIANRLCPESREFRRWTHTRTVSFHWTVFCLIFFAAVVLAVPMLLLDDAAIRYLYRPIEETPDAVAQVPVPSEIADDAVSPQTDTIFGNPVGFYLFNFPVHQWVSLWVKALLWVTCAVVGLLYNFYYRRDARTMTRVKKYIVVHSSMLWLMLLATGIWRSFVNLWNKVYTTPFSEGLTTVHGLFYVDVQFEGATRLYCGLLLGVGVAVLLNLFWRKRILWYATAGMWLVGYGVLIHAYPLAVYWWDVRNTPAAKEAPHIAQHIEYTRNAFDLDSIVEKDYEKGEATLEIINRNEEVKTNIQLWDRRVLYNVLRDAQIEVHHDFHPYTDVDRYRIGDGSAMPETPGSVARGPVPRDLQETPDSVARGPVPRDVQETPGSVARGPVPRDVQETPDSVARGPVPRELPEQYRQVLIAAREPSPDTKEWSKLKLTFTHGYGVCVAPVNEFLEGTGLPNLWVKDVPIKIKRAYTAQLNVSQPRIYYGEMTQDYVIANTRESEHNVTRKVDLGTGDSQQNFLLDTEEWHTPPYLEGTYHYDGSGGVALSGWFRRFCFAIRFDFFRILRQPAITPESRIMFWRKIGTRQGNRVVTDRLSHIAPFLNYDADPYIVINDGNLYWIIDFYVTSRHYPNSQFYKDDTSLLPDSELYAEPQFKKFNYIRNAGVAVVNAYTGEVDFYAIKDDEWITDAYRRAFPKLFKTIDEMPAGLQAHLRFPDYLTRIQAKMYGDYHVRDAKTFYDKDKQWKIPKEAYYSAVPDQEMMPYYAMLKLPGEEKMEFVNVIPFTPPRKVNYMKAWMVARCDAPHYGQRIVYILSDQVSVEGPKQVEDDINKHLSRSFLEWEKANDVIRGNLHVIPIEEGIFYVEPIYTVPKKDAQAEEDNSNDPVQNRPKLEAVVVKAANKALAWDTSFEGAIQQMFLGKAVPQPSADPGPAAERPSKDERLRMLVQQILEELDNP